MQSLSLSNRLGTFCFSLSKYESFCLLKVGVACTHIGKLDIQSLTTTTGLKLQMKRKTFWKIEISATLVFFPVLKISVCFVTE